MWNEKCFPHISNFSENNDNEIFWCDITFSFRAMVRRRKHVEILQLQKSLCRKCFGVCGAWSEWKGKVFDSWILRILLVINIVEWEFTASRYNFSPPKIKGRKRKVFSCRYTKLHVCFSWNFIICNVHKRNKEKNVFKVFIHNLEAFVHTTAWGEVAEEEDLLNSMLNIYAGKLLACDLW